MQKVAKLALELVDNQSSSQAVLPKNLEEPSSKRQINLNDDYLNIHGQLEKLKQVSQACYSLDRHCPQINNFIERQIKMHKFVRPSTYYNNLIYLKFIP